MKNSLNQNDLIVNPTPASKTLVEIVASLSQKYDDLFKSKDFFHQYKRSVMVRLYLKEGYKDYYKYLQGYSLPNLIENDHRHNLRILVSEFKCLYDKLLLNNYSLAYQYWQTKSLTNYFMTEEDKKNLFLIKFANNKISINEFKDGFGHYAINPYELSVKRFHEYSESDFKRLLKICKGIKIKLKPELGPEAVNEKCADIIPVIITLRELSKSKILLIVDKIRQELLGISKEENNKKIFESPLTEYLS